MKAEILKGDKVRVTLDGTVDYVNGDNSVDVRVEINEDESKLVEYISTNKVVVTKKAPPAEPAVGTIMSYYNGKYLHTAKGWSYLNSTQGELGETHKWEVFDHSAVRVMTAGEPVTAR